jgi:hypothetical protein
MYRPGELLDLVDSRMFWHVGITVQVIGTRCKQQRHVRPSRYTLKQELHSTAHTWMIPSISCNLNTATSMSTYHPHQWSSAADSYDDKVGRMDQSAVSRIIDRVTKQHPFTPFSYVVDLGSGTGSITIELLARHSHLKLQRLTCLRF